MSYIKLINCIYTYQNIAPNIEIFKSISVDMLHCKMAKATISVGEIAKFSLEISEKNVS